MPYNLLTEAARDASRLRSASRRDFLRVAAVGSAIVVLPGVVTACGNAVKTPTAPGKPRGAAGAVTLDLHTDAGVLNYAYALEQLEAAFYVHVLSHPASAYTAADVIMFSEICKHEEAHRDFLKAALGSNAIADLSVDFSSIDFTSRTAVLTASRKFEDTGVGAYNGAGKLLSNPDYLTIAGKIVSVEARHAATIRDTLQPKTAYFAGDDVVDTNGLDQALDPSTVLGIVAPFVTTTITVA